MDLENLKKHPNCFYYTDLGVLLCGDCLSIMPHLEPVDLVLTDPQYKLASGKKANILNASSGRNSGNILKGIVPAGKDWGMLQGDEKPFDPIPFIQNNSILWGANHYSKNLPDSPTWLVWDKRRGVKPDDNSDCELAWSNIGGPARIYYHLWMGICREGSENIAIQGSKFHPFQKPIALMLWCLSFVPGAETVLDPFLGSGTTAVACERLNRRWIGIEISEAYCAIAKQRIENERKQRKLF